jgi:hypothetical protein
MERVAEGEGIERGGMWHGILVQRCLRRGRGIRVHVGQRRKESWWHHVWLHGLRICRKGDHERLRPDRALRHWHKPRTTWFSNVLILALVRSAFDTLLPFLALLILTGVGDPILLATLTGSSFVTAFTGVCTVLTLRIVYQRWDEAVSSACDVQHASLACVLDGGQDQRDTLWEG